MFQVRCTYQRFPGWRLAPTVFLLAAGLAGGCKKDAASTAQTAAPPAQVRVGYFANLTHAQAVLGVSSGEFAQAVAPSQFNTKVFNAGPSLIEALFAKEIDVGYVGPSPALTGFDKSNGQGLKVIAGAAANGVLVVARNGSGINTLADLAGKKLATPQYGNTQDIAARHYLKSDLRQTELSNILPIANAEQAAQMARGEIDASWAPEPWASVLVAQTGAKVVAAESDLWPEKKFTITVLVTTPEFLKDHSDVVEKLLRVHLDWTDRLRREPETYLPQLDTALFALTNKKLPAGVLKSALANVVFTEEPLDYTFTRFAGWSYDLGFARKPIETKGLVDTDLLKKAQAAPRSSAPVPATKPAG